MLSHRILRILLLFIFAYKDVCTEIFETTAMLASFSSRLETEGQSSMGGFFCNHRATEGSKSTIESSQMAK